MADETSLIDSIERIEAASRRTHPIMLLGLLGIVAGFIFLIVYLDRLRGNAEAQADQWKATASQLERTVGAARDAVRNRDLDRAARLLGVALTQTRQLVAVAEQAGPSPSTERPRPRPRPPRPGPVAPVTPSDPPVKVEAETPAPGPQTNTRPQPAASVLVNNTRQPLQCGPAFMARSGRPLPTAIAPGAQASLVPGLYVCRSGAAERTIAIGRSGDPERIVATTARDGSLSFAGRPSN